MTVAQVKIGETYLAKVSGKLVKVRVLGERTTYHGRTGYEAVNLSTNRTLHLKSAARLRPLPALLSFYLDANGQTTQITRSEAVQLVNECIGVGEWLNSLRQARLPEGLLVLGHGLLRARVSE
jgi:hypothetical protein